MKKIKLDALDFQVLSKEQLRTIVAGGGSGGLGCLHGILCTDGNSAGHFPYAGQCRDASGTQGGCACYPMDGGGGREILSMQCMVTTIIGPPPIA